MTYLAARNYMKGRQIFSNYNLNFPHQLVNTPEEIVDMKEGMFCGDELWTWADSRMSGSKKNKFLTYILSKSRKRGINISYTVQYFKQIDIRIRAVTDFIAVPRLNDKETICKLFIYDQSGMLHKTFKFRTAPIFQLYDTKEEVQELDFV